ncbi:MAG: anthranilate phosphoribosyltransferase, partial [Pseudomonadota bacterium]|nr:anthranilate phosphoribosyltransferase [Pseudomonadota bacterium]
GICTDEVVGFARAMRKISTKVLTDEKVVDCCGTGGDGINTFNISTCSAYISAASGVKVAKHGNKAITSNSGSADVLHDAGAKLDLSPEKVSQCISEVNFGFMFAPLHHQAMKNVAASRKEIAPNKTIFNMLGPITNPANAQIQLIGVFDKSAMHLVADSLMELGTSKAIVLNSRDGMDEASIYAETDIIEIKDNVKTHYTINPKDYGITGKNIDSIKTSNERSSLDFIFSVINNEESDAKEICVLNAALSVMLYKDIELNDSIAQCRESLSEYKVRDKFNQYIDFTNQV